MWADVHNPSLVHLLGFCGLFNFGISMPTHRQYLIRYRQPYFGDSATSDTTD